MPLPNLSHSRNIRVVDVSRYRNIETTLNEMDSSSMSACQLVHSHNDYFCSLCTEVNKDIIIRDDS